MKSIIWLIRFLEQKSSNRKKRDYQNNIKIESRLKQPFSYHQHNEWKDPHLKVLLWNFQKLEMRKKCLWRNKRQQHQTFISNKKPGIHGARLSRFREKMTSPQTLHPGEPISHVWRQQKRHTGARKVPLTYVLSEQVMEGAVQQKGLNEPRTTGNPGSPKLTHGSSADNARGVAARGLGRSVRAGPAPGGWRRRHQGRRGPREMILPLTQGKNLMR